MKVKKKKEQLINQAQYIVHIIDKEEPKKNLSWKICLVRVIKQKLVCTIVDSHNVKKSVARYHVFFSETILLE